MKLTRALMVFSLAVAPWLVNCGGKDEDGNRPSNAGGSAAAGSSGKPIGGSGGRASTAPGAPTHLSECETLCGRTADAGCSAGADSCVKLCATVTGFANCQPSIEAWLNCAKTAAIECDASGAPSFAGCEQSMSAAIFCAALTPAPPAVQQSCASYCTAIEDSGCSADTPVGDCRSACGMAGTVVTDCQSSLLAYLACATASGITCDASGQVDAAICSTEQFAFTGCLLTAVGASTLSSTGAGLLTGAAGAGSGIY
jgi:hypothetical protein